ncbi:MAG: class I SAM-dependent methyltransferase [Candidatus Rickettsiella isopodorum]|nr:class I SAM-dependent methyltransferase [Candidatus Rickettsiella isopodorum]
MGGRLIYWLSVSHQYQLYRAYHRIFKKHIKPGQELIDVGAGRLFYRRIIQNYTKNYKSIDVQKTHPEIDFIGSSSHTGLPDNSYDIVFCSMVLEHTPNPQESFKEFFRLLRPGGIAIIAVPFLIYLHNEPHDYYRYTKYALRLFVSSSGLQEITLDEIGGIFGAFGSVVAMALIGLTWRIPVINWIVFAFNMGIQLILLTLDMLFPTKKIFPANYLLVITK